MAENILNNLMKSQPTSVMLFSDYAKNVDGTDLLSKESLEPVLLGLFGEVGSIMATAKKHHREGDAFDGYRHAVVEEFGDTLWYFTALCRRLETDLESIFRDASLNYRFSTAANNLLGSPICNVATPLDAPELDKALLQMGEATTSLFALVDPKLDSHDLLVAFADKYLTALSISRVPFSEIIVANIKKISSRFDPLDYSKLPTFDYQFPEEEQLPKQFTIIINQRETGRSYMSWNGVFIGDPLTDNIRDPDGYRFHDVLHLAYAAILHWSPTIRGLIKHKRKSNPKIDEAEDGGRAIVIEEGLSTWIFGRAKALNYFEGHEKLSFDILKTVQQNVQGYEVSECPLSLWELAILEGYKVFRKVRKNNGGKITGDRIKRTLEYAPLDTKK